jgi:hypothetical protein
VDRARGSSIAAQAITSGMLRALAEHPPGTVGIGVEQYCDCALAAASASRGAAGDRTIRRSPGPSRRLYAAASPDRSRARYRLSVPTNRFGDPHL